MNQTDQETIATIALLAALADGTQTQEESAQLAEVFQRLGMTQLDEEARRAGAGKVELKDLAARLSGEDARKMAYDTALAVIHSDGAANPPEMEFINQLREVLGLSLSSVRESDHQATALAAAGTNPPDVQVNTGKPPSDAVLDDLIMKQAMLTGALEILPDRLANVAILPLQLRLVYMIGQHFGQKLDANQVKDLAGTLGLGAAAQVMESVVRKVLGGIAGGILG
ncbi:MAG TPA: TerB family tellurite resistance protein, partial [Gemmatimonadales bacterium]|nr:TerB family tellurite resistance protein [Gemmatimonadales bacterium]